MALGALVALSAVVTPLLVVPTASASSLEAPVIIQVPDGQTEVLAQKLSSLGVTPDETYSTTIDGAAAALTPSQVSSVLHSIPGAVVEPDHKILLSTVQSTPTWGIDALDQTATSVDHSYTYPDSAGEGVDVYVIDTGLRATTYATGGELFGRVTAGYNWALGSNNSVDHTDTRECLVNQNGQQEGGHGTHVAGTIASSTYGVAKKATIVPLRVFPCATWNPDTNRLDASASTSDVIAALDWAVARHQTTGRPAVVNMSLGGPCSGSDCSTDALVNAVNEATQPTTFSGRAVTGVTVVLAAGNSGVDACTISPASASSAITVGAVNESRAITSWSNYGACVSIFAPGSNITSLNAWQTPASSDPSATTAMSGTSMACPHVSGAAALYLAINPAGTPAQVKAALTSNSVSNTITSLSGNRASSPNKFLNISFLNVPTGRPTRVLNFALVGTGTTYVGFRWSPPAILNGGTISDYRISYRKAGTSRWILFADGVSTRTSVRVTRLAPRTSYNFAVYPKTAQGYGTVAYFNARTR